MTKLILLSAAVTLAAASAFAAEVPSLPITYYHYPPQLIVDNGNVKGPYAEQLERIVSTAGYKIDWFNSTIDEEARMLDEGRRAFCTTGRLFTPERGARWTFLPYLFDTVPGDIVVTTSVLKPQLLDHGDIGKVAEDRSLIGTLLGSGIYGPLVDPLLAEKPDWILRTAKSDYQLVNMVLMGRAHYTIVPEDQWFQIQPRLPENAHLVSLNDFGTLPPTPLHLVCSNAVDRKTIAALNKALASLGYPSSPLP